jgi:hypothetical protein
MSYPTLPRRVFNSPLIEYANFEDGGHINLIRLIKPYANGMAYAIYQTTKNPLCSNGMYKSYNSAKAKFDLMVSGVQLISLIVEEGTTSNKTE